MYMRLRLHMDTDMSENICEYVHIYICAQEWKNRAVVEHAYSNM